MRLSIITALALALAGPALAYPEEPNAVARMGFAAPAAKADFGEDDDNISPIDRFRATVIRARWNVIREQIGVNDKEPREREDD